MALTLDTYGHIPAAVSGTTTANPITGSFACGVNAEALVVMIFYAGNAQRTGGSPTFNSVGMTQVESTAGVTEVLCEMWYLLAPPTSGSYTVSIPNTNSTPRTAWVNMVSINAPSGNTIQKNASGRAVSGSGDNPTVNMVTTVSGFFAVACVATGDNSFDPTAQRGTEIYNDDPSTYGSASQYLSGSASGSVAMYWTEATADDYGAIAVAFEEVTGVPSLVVQNATQAQTAGNVTLTQNYLLSVNNATQLQSSDSVVLSQHYTLIVNNASQLQTAENVTVTYTEPITILTVQNASQTQTVEGVSLTQHYTLAVNGANQTQTSGTVTLTQHYILSVQNTEHEIESEPENITLTHHPYYLLIVDNASQSQNSDNLTITYVPMGVVSLTVQNATQSQTAENVSLTQHQLLQVNNATQTHTVEGVTLTQHQVLTINGATQAQTASMITLIVVVTAWTLAVDNATQLQYADNLYIGEPITPPDVFVGDITYPNIVVTRANTVTTRSSTTITKPTIQTVKPEVTRKKAY